MVRELYERIRAARHEITYDWTTHKKAQPYTENVDCIRSYAEHEIAAILASDVFIYLTHERGTTLHMEYGAALAKKQRGEAIAIYVVGEHNARSPWYFSSLVQRVDSVEAVFADLGIA